MLPPLMGTILYNRAIWFSLAFFFLTIAYYAYRFESHGAKSTNTEKSEPVVIRKRSGPLPAPRFDRTSTLAQCLKWTRFEMAQVFKSPAFFVLLALGLLNAIGGLSFATEQRDFIVLPVTNLMITTLNGSFTIIPMIVAIYYAGELVWRERDRRTHEVFDACPVPDWAFVVPKILAITLVLVAMIAISVLAGAGVQAFNGYFNFEWSHYLVRYIAPNAIEATEIAALAIFVQAMSPHKYIGWGVMALIQITLITFGNIGYEHHLYLYGTTTPVPLSDMNGQGTFWIGRAWFQVYWCAFALILAVLSYALWRRGTETRLRPRLARLPRRLNGYAGVLMAFAIVVWAASGAFIFYNTNILNPYRTSVEEEAWTGDYEKSLYKYKDVPPAADHRCGAERRDLSA